MNWREVLSWEIEVPQSLQEGSLVQIIARSSRLEQREYAGLARGMVGKVKKINIPKHTVTRDNEMFPGSIGGDEGTEWNSKFTGDWIEGIVEVIFNNISYKFPLKDWKVYFKVIG